MGCENGEFDGSGFVAGDRFEGGEQPDVWSEDGDPNGDYFDVPTKAGEVPADAAADRVDSPSDAPEGPWPTA